VGRIEGFVDNVGLIEGICVGWFEGGTVGRIDDEIVGLIEGL